MIEGWQVTSAIVVATFLGNIIAMRVGFSKDINRNSDRLDDHSKRIKENTDNIVPKEDCKERRDEFHTTLKDMKEQMTRIEDIVIANGRGGGN